MVLSVTPSYPCLSQSMLIFILRRWSIPSGPSITCSGPSTPRRARNNVFMAPSADCAEARPFHCDSGVAREGQLRCMVKAAAHEVGMINEARLHRVAQCHSEHKVAATGSHVVGDRQR